MKSSVRRIAMKRRSALVATAAAVVTLGAIALAAGPTVMTGTARVAGRTKTVLISSTGQTLYTLSGERVGSLKCLTKTCFAIWPPLKVGSGDRLTKGPGVSGTLSELHRVKGGFYQVMLDGHPLYRFAADSSKGSAKGEGIKSFNGTWHVATP